MCVYIYICVCVLCVLCVLCVCVCCVLCVVCCVLCVVCCVLCVVLCVVCARVRACVRARMFFAQPRADHTRQARKTSYRKPWQLHGAHEHVSNQNPLTAREGSALTSEDTR